MDKQMDMSMKYISDDMIEKMIDLDTTLLPELIALRRDFHAYPELGWMEMRTSSIVARLLTTYGCDEVLMGEDVCDRESRMGVPSKEALEAHYEDAKAHGADPEFLPCTKDGMTGVIGILHCGPGPVVAMRFDLDALPFTESSDDDHFPVMKGFRSTCEGIMHACGHDGHTAIGLGTVKTLCQMREALHGTIKFIFQPAEEGVRGAKSIVAHGHLDDVDILLGAHMAGKQSITKPFIGVNAGHSLATTKIDVTFHGEAAHAGIVPEEGHNAMLAMATAVLNLHAIPRFSKGGTRINVGRVTAGNGRNVICPEAKLELEVRGDTSEANDFMEAQAYRIIQAAADMYGCRCETKIMGSARSGSNTPELNERVLTVCKDQLGLDAARLRDGGATGSEDYSYMSERVMSNGGQSCYFLNVNALSAPLHNEKFDFEEIALLNGVKAFVGMGIHLLGE